MKNKNSHLKHGFKIPSDYFEEFKMKTSLRAVFPEKQPA